MTRPLVKPIRPEFSSGPCAKRPGWSLEVLKKSLLGRSHRHKHCKNKLKEVIDLSKSILNIPNDYLLGIVPGSDTGAVEIAIWNLLGPKPVTMLVWDSFGSDWAKDIELQLKLKDLEIIKADYGKLPSLSSFDFKSDIVFNWNGTTSGVCVPNGDWIKSSRDSLTICDATSAAFAMEIDWSKLDVGTFSWQKSLGGEAGHGVIILSPKAVDRINTYNPNRAIPKLFQLKKNNEINFKKSFKLLEEIMPYEKSNSLLWRNIAISSGKLKKQSIAYIALAEEQVIKNNLKKAKKYALLGLKDKNLQYLYKIRGKDILNLKPLEK